ncbi:alpha/beta hydrolase [Streptacidiphilus sp. ASG 303]|uniref:alpha/beta fold hydrolase n=1 Tax=Streptacidiphilus sp. ASG 303 TaxID=2896847 RepID=UPI001E3F5534|nr:alpha/beta hydrolase [Streptacidiphilus sp. ASG 303]MCD0484131.1 alpha/beta hydrolase [Streptacidiphilus sp. ASG 303]
MHKNRKGLLSALVGLMALAALILPNLSSAAASVGGPRSQAPSCAAPERPKSKGYDSATRHDVAFNKLFRHCFTTVDGVQMHYVIGGTGPKTMVLLHGWPENWYAYRGIMPKLLPGRTVIAVDLPGLGDSTGEPHDYAAATMATYVHDLLDRIGKRRHVELVAHDIGAGVAYPLAAKYRSQVDGLFMIDFPLVGKNLRFADFSNVSFHFLFNQQSPLAEQLVTGREKQFFNYFYPTFSHSPNVIPSPGSVREYIRTYSRPQVLHGGFEFYRYWHQDELDNNRLEQKPLTIPVRMISEQGFLNVMLSGARGTTPAATGAEVAGAGHWLAEEAPQRIIDEIDAFYPAR